MTAKSNGKPKPKAKAATKPSVKEPASTAEPAATRPSTKPATNANGVTQTAALTPGSEPDDVLSGLIR